jgi:hypothetical protein
MPSSQDRAIIHELASKVAEVAALPIQEETRRLWRCLNGLKPERPMVTIDQVCWNAMNLDDELTMRCEDASLHGYEWVFRAILFQWKRFPVDMVVEPFVRVPKAIHNTGFGVGAHEDIAVGDPTNSVVGHRFINQFETDEDIERIQMPKVSHDPAETERRLAFAHDLFGDVLEIRAEGADLNLSLWDPISTWMSVEGACWALIDRPEYMHKLVGRLTDGYSTMIDQLEEQGLLCGPQSLIHCTGAWTDELPAEGYDPERWTSFRRRAMTRSGGGRRTCGAWAWRRCSRRCRRRCSRTSRWTTRPSC